MTIADLRDRVTLRSKTPTADSQGGRATTYPVLKTVWAHVAPGKSGESIQAEQMGAQTPFAVTIRTRTDVTPQMRVSWTPYRQTAKTLEIHGVTFLDNTREFQVLTCGEVI